jgi:hypothetical protein
VPKHSSTPVAKVVPFDNTTPGAAGLISTDVQSAIEEIRTEAEDSASPGFTWGSSGNTTSGSWLINDSVPSNKAGRAIFLNNATLEYVFVRCELAATFNLDFYEHDGITFTLITTVSIVAARGGAFPIASLPLTTGKELAVQLSGGSAKNPVVGCILKGTFV